MRVAVARDEQERIKDSRGTSCRIAGYRVVSPYSRIVATAAGAYGARLSSPAGTR
jgi:hypothetical protein